MAILILNHCERGPGLQRQSYRLCTKHTVVDLWYTTFKLAFNAIDVVESHYDFTIDGDEVGGLRKR